MTLKFLSAAAALCCGFCLTVPAQAAPVFQGAYIGFDLGGGFGTSRKDFAPSPLRSQTGSTTGNYNIGGAVGGAEAGLDWAQGGFVFGIKGNVLASGADGTAHAPNPAYTYETRNRWLLTLGPRLGYELAPGILPYVTGGLAAGDVGVKSNVTRTGRIAVNYDPAEAGWSTGAGVEVALPQNWRVNAEYLHVSLAASVPSDVDTPTHVSFQENLFLAGLVYGF